MGCNPVDNRNSSGNSESKSGRSIKNSFLGKRQRFVESDGEDLTLEKKYKNWNKANLALLLQQDFRKQDSSQSHPGSERNFVPRSSLQILADSLYVKQR